MITSQHYSTFQRMRRYKSLSYSPFLTAKMMQYASHIFISVLLCVAHVVYTIWMLDKILWQGLLNATNHTLTSKCS